MTDSIYNDDTCVNCGQLERWCDCGNFQARVEFNLKAKKYKIQIQANVDIVIEGNEDIVMALNEAVGKTTSSGWNMAWISVPKVKFGLWTISIELRYVGKRGGDLLNLNQVISDLQKEVEK